MRARFKEGKAGAVDPGLRPKRRPDLRNPTMDVALLRQVIILAGARAGSGLMHDQGSLPG